MPMLAVLKGKFQADGKMQPVAYAQVIEQAVRVIIILLGTWIVVSTSKNGMKVPDYVLSKFTEEEISDMAHAVKKSADACEA